MAYPQNGTRGTGRRKEAVVRARLLPGKGTILMNGQPLIEYLNNRKTLEYKVLQPLAAAGVQDKYNVVMRAHGGGKAGQADAARLAIARALAEKSDELNTVMRAEGLMTRDARVKERKKYGLHKARKRPQFSKR